MYRLEKQIYSKATVHKNKPQVKSLQTKIVIPEMPFFCKSHFYSANRTVAE